MQLPFPSFLPTTTWKPPDMSKLPSWEGAKRVSYDIESKDPQLKKLGIGVRRPDSHMVGYSFSIEDGPKHYVPFRHDGGDNVSEAAALKYLRDQAKCFTGVLVGGRLSYDLDFTAQEGAVFRKVKWFRDIQVAEPLLWEHAHRYGNDALAEKYGVAKKKEALLRAAADIYGIDPKSELYKLPARFVGEYAEWDAEMCHEIIRKQETRLEDDKLWDIYNLESKLLPILVKMRRRGVQIDTKRFTKMREHLEKQKVSVCDEINSSVKIKISPSDLKNSMALGTMLAAEGVNVPRTAAGAYSIVKEWLANEPHLACKKLNNARSMATMISYSNSLDKYITPSGRVHPTFNQLKTDKEDQSDTKGTVTGRLSCVIGSTTIRTAHHGDIPISNVRVGDMVWTHKERWRRVTKLIDQGIQTTIEVRFCNGLSITCTSDHQFLSGKGAWVTAGELCDEKSALHYSLFTGKGQSTCGIEKINSVGSNQVYDISVAEDHSYWSEGVFSHNCNDPNEQQQPIRHPEMGAIWRGIYIPDYGDEGIWVSSDYSQQEPRLTVHYAELTGCNGGADAAEQYRENPLVDCHDMSAKITGLDRKDAKQIFLAVCYSMGGAKLCRSMGLPTRIKELRDGRKILVAGEEGQRILDQFDNRMPFVRQLNQQVERKAKKRGEIRTLLGRAIHFPTDDNGNFDWTHKALNRLIQGGSADQMKKAMVDADEAGIRLQLQVHDEVDFSARSMEEAERLAQIMRDAVPLRVPSRVDLECGKSWGEIDEKGRRQCQEFYN